MRSQVFFLQEMPNISSAMPKHCLAIFIPMHYASIGIKIARHLLGSADMILGFFEKKEL